MSSSPRRTSPRAAAAGGTPPPSRVRTSPQASASPRRASSSGSPSRERSSPRRSPPSAEAGGARQPARSPGRAGLARSPQSAKSVTFADTEWSCRANDVLTIRLVRADLPPALGTSSLVRTAEFAPQLTHQWFRGDETIVGYKGLRIEVLFDASTLHACYSVSYDEMRPNPDQVPAWEADDVGAVLREHIPHALPSESALRAKVGEEAAAAAGAEITGGAARGGGGLAPAGTLQQSYERGGALFDVYKSAFTMADAVAAHQRMRVFLLLFVDMASYIDEADDRWELLSVYRRSGDLEVPLFVGYATVYPFVAMHHTAGLVERLRLSQILILPPYQRGGHGSALLQAVYDDAAARRCHEVSVEDPSPGMMRCRLSTDVANCVRIAHALPGAAAPSWARRDDFVAAAHERLRLTASQAATCFETLALAAMAGGLESADAAATEHRLAVKKRLYKENPDLQDCANMKLLLQEMFLEQQALQEGVIAKLHLRPDAQRTSPAGEESSGSASDFGSVGSGERGAAGQAASPRAVKRRMLEASEVQQPQ